MRKCELKVLIELERILVSELVRVDGVGGVGGVAEIADAVVPAARHA